MSQRVTSAPTDEPEQAAAPIEPATQAPKKARKPRGPKKEHRKRPPARPYRKLQQEVLDGRIGKLQKRITRASDQLKEAQAYLSKYDREQEFRHAEPTPEPAPEA